jgi:hypothetical protein
MRYGVKCSELGHTGDWSFLRQKRHHSGHDQQDGHASDGEGAGASKGHQPPHLAFSTHWRRLVDVPVDARSFRRALIGILPQLRGCGGHAGEVPGLCFVARDVSVIKLDRRSGIIEPRHLHDTQIVQVRDKFIAVFAHLVSVILECRSVHVQVRNKLLLERCFVGDDLRPVVLRALIAKQLAPLEHALIQEISVDRDPEIPVRASRLTGMRNTVVGKVAHKVAAHERHTA